MNRHATAPQHVAIIMDGNGRWAKRRGLKRIFGHRNAIEAVRAAVTAAGKAGVQYLTLYTFSEENWKRPQDEIDNLMRLLVDAIRKETPELHKNGVQLRCIGNTASLPATVQEKLNACIRTTKDNKGLVLMLALSYSGQWDIVQAVTRWANAPDNTPLTPERFEQYLSTAGIAPPELLIRTGGEQRLSNFFLWQAAYTEFYFLDLLWPDFRESHFFDALNEYGNRERRFGQTGEQLKTS
ncbi:MAG: di-trans,poly-cis-decaprenylcistransferase [Prevotellaceae bacterium]|jgi:undecaprenyl diphosphate synthase|nr:di-trans,poly-cis-decaprenylcistransferase [Prevotellaceae bacterium]